MVSSLPLITSAVAMAGPIKQPHRRNVLRWWLGTLVTGVQVLSRAPSIVRAGLHNTGAVQQNWAGDWIGKPTHWPGDEPIGPDVTIRFHIGPMPQSDNVCTPWRQDFTANGTTIMTKNYMYCRGDNETDVWIDEGQEPPSPRDSGFRLPSVWMGKDSGTILVCTFKYKGVQLIDTMRVLPDGSLFEEMITFSDDNAPHPSKVVPTFPLDLDRFIFRRDAKKGDDQ